MRVVLVGAGSVGRSIARELLLNDHQVLLIDKYARESRVQSIPEATWLLADACEVATLHEAQLEAADVVVVKIGYLEPDLYEMQRSWKMALTPGGVDQDLVRLGHTRIDRPMVPFDKYPTAVRLSALTAPGPFSQRR